MILRKLRSIKHIARAVIVLLLLLGAAEVFLRWHDSPSHVGENTAHSGNSTLLEESWTTHHRLKPFQHVTLENHDDGQAVTLDTNSFGLRGREWEIPKPVGVFRILVLGDENVLAAAIPEAQTLTSRLQDYLQSKTRLQVEVVNAGVPGYCPLLSYLYVKHRLLALQPDLVILNFDMGDVADDYAYRRHTRIDDRGVPLGCTNPLLEAASPSRPPRLAEHSYVVQYAHRQLGRLWKEKIRAQREQGIDSRLGRYAWLEDDPPDWSTHIEHALSPIEHLQRAVEGVYARLIVAVHPAPWQVCAEACNGEGVRPRYGVPEGAVYTSHRPFEILNAYASQRQIPLCDTSEVFRQTRRPARLYSSHKPQLSALGHELYARLLAEFVETNVPGLWMHRHDQARTISP